MPDGVELEAIRDEPLVGAMAYRIDPNTISPVLFHSYANTAYFLTVDAMRNFQQSAAVGGGPFVVPAIALWFTATESYISTIDKACVDLDARMAVAGRHGPAGARVKTTGKVVEKARAIKLWVAADCPPAPPLKRSSRRSATRCFMT